MNYIKNHRHLSLQNYFWKVFFIFPLACIISASTLGCVEGGSPASEETLEPFSKLALLAKISRSDGTGSPTQLEGTLAMIADSGELTEINGIETDEGLIFKQDKGIEGTWVLTINAPGYAKQTRRIKGHSKGWFEHSFNLYPLRQTTVTLPTDDVGLTQLIVDDYKVDFRKESLVFEDTGEFITGDVTVDFAVYDVLSGATSPASLIAIRPEESGVVREVGLKSFGMLDLQLSKEGRKVQIASNKTLRITLPIANTVDSAELSDAGEAELWYLDESTGLWALYEESASLIYDANTKIFTAEVPHLTLINVDVTVSEVTEEKESCLEIIHAAQPESANVIVPNGFASGKFRTTISGQRNVANTPCMNQACSVDRTINSLIYTPLLNTDTQTYGPPITIPFKLSLQAECETISSQTSRYRCDYAEWEDAPEGGGGLGQGVTFCSSLTDDDPTRPPCCDNPTPQCCVEWVLFESDPIVTMNQGSACEASENNSSFRCAKIRYYECSSDAGTDPQRDGATCTLDEDCCSGACIDGVCADPEDFILCNGIPCDGICVDNVICEPT